VLFNHFTSNNCFNVERLTGYINLSNEADRTIELKVKSDVAIEQFGAYLMIQEQNLTLRVADGEDASAAALPAGKWKVIRLTPTVDTWDAVTLDASRVVGICLYARNGEDPQPKGTIEIDYIKVGSSARSFTASSEATASGQGYTFSFDGDAAHTCTNPVNTTGNPNFTFKLNDTIHAAVLTQKITGNKYEVFALEFTDRDCFLQPISFESSEQRFLEIRIKPNTDIPSFGLSISADQIKGSLWDYVKVQKFVALKGNEWNVVKLPVNLKGQFGNELNPKMIRGVVLVFNPDSLNDKLKDGIVTYEIDYIKVGDAITAPSKK
jgi:hypothetical protein